MTYNVFGGTLNLILSQSVHVVNGQRLLSVWHCRCAVCVIPRVDGCRWERDNSSSWHSWQSVDRVISARH